MDEYQTNSRGVAIGIISEWLRTGDFPDRMMSGVTDDRAFVMELVYGSVRRKRTLEWIIKRFAPRKQRPFEMACLMIGIYQLYFMDNVAEHAAINETVEAVKTGPIRSNAASFINGVLRNFQRQEDEIHEKFKTRPIGIRESHPEILVRRWKTEFGAEKTEELCRWNNTSPQTIITPNLLKTSVDDYLEKLKAEDIDAEPHPHVPDRSLVLPRGVSVPSLPGYDDGLFSVQDPSTLNAVDLLDPQPGETVLDACAAPGGKTVLIAQKMKNEGKIIAMDHYRDRLDTLRENIERMGITIADIIKGNAAGAKDLANDCKGYQVDRILLDVPCTNTGVIRRRPDARWRFTNNRLKDLVFLQESMLNSASQLLRPGGTLVYSTCSLEADEGEQLVESWLKTNSKFRLKHKTATWPPDTETDGSFAAAIVKG